MLGPCENLALPKQFSLQLAVLFWDQPSHSQIPDDYITVSFITSRNAQDSMKPFLVSVSHDLQGATESHGFTFPTQKRCYQVTWCNPAAVEICIKPDTYFQNWDVF